MLRVLSTPIFYTLELTPSCNNRCRGCYNVFVADKPARSGPQMRPPLSFDDWRMILDKLAPLAHRIKLSGGEPTLHPEFDRIVRHIAALDVPFTLFTNARWRAPDRLLDLLTQIPPFAGFLVSLHGARAESHEAFTGIQGSFDETVENTSRAVRRGLPVTTSTVLTQANLRELPEIVALATRLGARACVFNRYLGDEIPDLVLSKTGLIDATHIVEQLKAAGAPVKFGVCIPQCATPGGNTSTGCLAGVAYCTIDPWGNLRPCNHSELIGGNLLAHSVEDAWQSSGMQRFRSAFLKECQSYCSAFERCHGGCKAMTLELGKDPLMGQPLPVSSLPLPTAPLRLGAQWRPLRRYRTRTEAFGLILTRGNAIVPVRLDSQPILDRLNGQATLSQIGHQLGAEALSLIGELYRQGLVEMLT